MVTVREYEYEPNFHLPHLFLRDNAGETSTSGESLSGSDFLEPLRRPRRAGVLLLSIIQIDAISLNKPIDSVVK